MENTKGMTRRGFLGAAGIGAAGLALAGLAGCASQPQSQLSAQAEQPTEKTKDEPAKSGAVEPSQVDTDVLVIGAGVSGLTAAIAAAEGGADVVLVEQDEGLKTVYGHSITAIGTSFQKEMGEDWTPEELVDFWNTYGDEGMDRDFQLFAAEHSAETIDWLIEHGVDIVGVTNAPTNPFQYPARTFVTSSDRDGVKAYLEPLKAKAEEDGVQITFSLTIDELVKESDRVVGALGTDGNGQPVSFSAKAVIVCTGGFGGSSDMVRLYAPLTPNHGTFVGPSAGFAMAQAKKVGAQLCAPGGTMSFFKNADGGFADNPGLGMFVTREGKRWVNENLYFLDRAGLAYKQGISEYWAIYDSTLFDSVAAASADDGLASGSIVSADTVEDLARAMNVNVRTLAESVDRYNGFCESGRDDDFGKPATRRGRVFDPDADTPYSLALVDKDYTLLNPVKTAPFYAINMLPTDSLNGTNGGMRTNTDGQVLDIDEQPIPGLYAAGEAASGHFLGFFYPQSGSSLLNCFCYGRYAGQNAAKSVKA